MDDSIRLVNHKLEYGEQLLWVGKPSPMRMVLLHGRELIGAVLTIVFGAVLLIWLLNRLPAGTTIQSVPTQVWIVMAAYLLTPTPPLLHYWFAKHTVYAVTNRRAIILHSVLWIRIVQSYRDIQHVTQRDLAGGRGDLIFVRERLKLPLLGVREIGFYGIDNSQDVERLLLSLFP